MSVLQYIGARYVPKFYVNSVDGSTRWENNVEYEPLTWATLPNDEMYLSKKTVPVAIGTPADNEEYWLKVGDFNGYIRQLQDAVDEINETMGGLSESVESMENCDIHSFWHNKKVCVYGDSLSSEDNDEYWAYLTARDNTIQLTNRAVGGTTIDQGRAAINAAADLANFDIIVIAFGTNEWQSSWGYDSIKNRYEATFEILKNKISGNADEQVVVITPFYSYRNFGGTGTEANKAGLTIDMVNDAIAEVAYKYGYPVLNFYSSSSCNSSNYQVRLQDSSGIFVHEIGDFSKELSYIVERWDGQSYIPRPYVYGKNALSPIEFCQFTKRLTKAEFNSIPAGQRDGVSMKVNTGIPKMAFNRYLGKDVEYLLHFWANNIAAISIKNSGGTTVWSQVGNANTEFKARVRVPSDGYYYLQINTDPNVSETIIGGLYFGRADGLEIPMDWHACNVSGGTGTISYKYDDDLFVLSSGAVTAMSSGVILQFNELAGLPSVFMPVMGANATSPTMTTGIIEGNHLQIVNSSVGVTYVPATVTRMKCYDFDI